jgi:adenylosuccinate lyase
MSSSFDSDNYVSPFTWRYGSESMRTIFSEKHKYELWRKVWVSLAKAQHKAGLVSDEELADLEKQQHTISIEEILRIEKDTKHDVVAAIKEFAGKAKIGGGKIHLGMTSMDVVDNVEALRVKEGLEIIETEIKAVLTLLAEKIEAYADVVCLGYTHLQPAEPTTVGYRFAFYAQDLLMDYELLQFVQKNIVKGKGIKGAVGTQASFAELLQEKGVHPQEMEKEILDLLDLDAVTISTQVYSRKIDYMVLSLLASIASSIAKFAGDLRILQSPNIGEWSEPFGEKQVGSSAMPFKKNPIHAEKICSLARLVASYPNIALENASLSYLERTLDDSANRRIVTPEAFLATDDILLTAKKLLTGLVINKDRILYNLSQYAPFLASEGILMTAVKNGADRQIMHESLRDIAMVAWESVAQGKENPMEKLLQDNEEITRFVAKEKIETLLNVSHHIGTAPERAREIAKKIKELL